jgi:biopolymer transport protein ExbB
MAGKPRVLFLALGVLVGNWALETHVPARAQTTPVQDVPKPANPAGVTAENNSSPVPLNPSAGAASASKPAVDRSSIFRLLINANPMLWPLAICSIVTLGYVMERFAGLRHEKVIPREFVDRFLERLANGKLDR